MIYKTNVSCCTGHPDFELEVGELTDKFSQLLIEYLETAMGEGVQFQPGETILFGASLLRISSLDTNTGLTLLEPEPESMPIRWVRSIEQSTLKTLRQRYIAEDLDLLHRLDFPNPYKNVYFCDRARADQCTLVRGKKSTLDEGWFITCSDESHDHSCPENLCAVSVYEMGVRFPLFNLFAPLPVGVSVRLDGPMLPQIQLDGLPRVLALDSFLARTWREQHIQLH